MTREEFPERDQALVARLEQIAATAGDPPEHGLDRVAKLRRRRTRHRRGAVAATMALAVSGSLIFTLRDGAQEHDADVAAADGHDDLPWHAVLPDELVVDCSTEGISVPIASIRPQEDGMHVRVRNDGDSPVQLRIEAAEPGLWRPGEVEVRPGERAMVQPVAPGPLTVRCRVGDELDERRAVNLVDVDRHYEEPRVACPRSQRMLPENERIELDGEVGSFEDAVWAALDGYLDEDLDEVAALDAYPQQVFGAPARGPVVQVLREGDPVALVQLVGDEAGPWGVVQVVDACQDLLNPDDGDGEGGDGDGEDDGDGDGDEGRDDEPGDGRSDRESGGDEAAAVAGGVSAP